MSAVQNVPGYSQVGATRVVASDSLSCVGTSQLLSAAPAGAGENPFRWSWFAPNVTGGGLTARQLELWGWAQSSPGYPALDAQFATAAFATNGVAGSQIPVFRTNSCAPLNFAFRRGTVTIAGATVVPVAGITTNATVRFMLVGATGTQLTTAVAAPTFTVQPNVSFTITGKDGCIYAWEVLDQ